MRLLVGLMSVFGVLQSLHQIQAQYKEKDESGCEFPFKYNGKSYSKCTKGVEKFPWCSYTKEFIGVWKYCYDMKKTIWECKGKCEKYRGDEYPSCKSNYHGRRRYCTEEIKYLADSDATALAEDCPNRYSNTPMHTACLATSKYAVKIGVTDQDKKEIIELHDKWRTNLKEPAKNMMKMSYDEDLAFVAQKHASRCSFAHDQPQQRVMGTGKNPGQNIVKVSGSKDANITEMFEKMYKAESPRWEYGVGIIPKFKKYHQGAGHYTQMLLEHVSKMGCGQAICVYAERKEKIFVCNYDNM